METLPTTTCTWLVIILSGGWAVMKFFSTHFPQLLRINFFSKDRKKVKKRNGWAGVYFNVFF